MRELKPILGLDEISSKARLINLKVHTHDGKETVITVTAGDQIKMVKEKLFGEAGAKDVSNYKVVLLTGNKVLEDQHTIQQEGIIEDDQLLICRKRRNVTSHFRKSISYSSKGPDLQLIKKCSEHLDEEKGSGATSPALGYAGMFDFFGELKRILISLTEVASLVQHVSSDESSSSAHQDVEMETDGIEIQVDSLCMKKLTDMGFEEQRARKALLICKMNPMQAMEWLLQHENDADIDEPLTADELSALAAELQPTKRKRAAAGAGSTGKKKEFAANPRCVSNLREMGFEEKDILLALKIASNSQERALEWLLGDRQVPEQSPDSGLDPTSPLYTAIMDHPVVQLGLTNPRILHAFEDMLDNPNNSGQYINDPEIGPVLLQISRIVQSFSR